MPPSPLPSARFETTRWSLVLQAGRPGGAAADEALESLCRNYWYPLNVYARRRVADVHAAQDLTQGFFARLLEKEYLQAADREKGRFRSFLLTMFQRFLSKERDRADAQMRGGGRQMLSWDLDSAEALYCREPADEFTPERTYERRWALTLLQRVLTLLGDEYADKGKGELFEQCRVFLTGDSGAPGYSELGARLAMSEGAVKVAVHRLRQRYRELLRLEVAQTVSHEDDVSDELNALLARIIHRSSNKDASESV